MCLEAIWGHNIQTLNCVGYDHNWVKQYVYEDDAAPLLPKGTIVHLIGFLDTTPANKNPADPRNWAGGGRRSIANMFIDLGYSVSLTEEQFQAEMAKRRKNDEEPRTTTTSAVRSAGRRPSRRPRRRRRASREASAVAGWAAVAAAGVAARGRERARTRFTYSTGQTISPAYEGWMSAPDGGYILYFGYMNTNWLAGIRHRRSDRRTPSIRAAPIAASPRTSIRGASPFLFTRAGAEGSRPPGRLVWTLTSNGQDRTRLMRRSKTDYQIDNQVISTEIGGDFRQPS